MFAEDKLFSNEDTDVTRLSPDTMRRVMIYKQAKVKSREDPKIYLSV